MTKNTSSNTLRFLNFNPLTDWEWKADKNNRIVPLMTRPTGLLDPEIILKPMEFMIDDIMALISEVVEKNERMLITTITKRSSEELTDYLLENGVRVKYLHSEVETLERLEILKELREGKIDVIVWVNLLREGLDLPEVSKICILDADKMWFLRSETSLIQIIWRAARNVNGKVYMYVEKLKERMSKGIERMSEDIGERVSENENQRMIEDMRGMKQYLDVNFKKEIDWLYRIDKWKLCNEEWLIVSEAMKKAINLTNYRRKLQSEYNKKNGIEPKTIFSSIKDIWVRGKKKEEREKIVWKWKKNFEREIKRLELEMDIAAANLEFERAAELRDMILEMKK